MVATVATTVLHILWLWLFVTVADLMIIGVVISSYITFSMQYVICVVYANTLP